VSGAAEDTGGGEVSVCSGMLYRVDVVAVAVVVVCVRGEASCSRSRLARNANAHC
jgi:uncharacterized FlgJ-related protein